MAAQKKLEAGSKYASFDKDGDGVVTDEEFEMEQKLVQLENEDKKLEPREAFGLVKKILKIINAEYSVKNNL